jgi:hypothetical protein
MNREQLEHVIRAAAANADTAAVVIVGSQAILGSVPQPASQVLVRSMEADVFPLDHPERAILIDGAIGERSLFHETFGYYAHGVGLGDVVLPRGWRERLVPVCNENTRGCTGWCLELHDLAVSKLVAAREKDLEFLRAMQQTGLLEPDVLRSRVRETELGDSEARSLLLARCENLLSA